MATGYLRRRLSSAVMRTNVKCLLERLDGEGQEGQAGGRREEEQAKMEREVHWLERITGRNLPLWRDFPQVYNTVLNVHFETV